MDTELAGGRHGQPQTWSDGVDGVHGVHGVDVDGDGDGVDSQAKNRGSGH